MEGTADPQRWAERATPYKSPDWDCNIEEGGPSGEISGGYFTRPQEEALKPMSMAKPSEVVQIESKSPSEFYEKLCEACRLYTPIDPEAAGSQVVINAAFVSQPYPENVRWGDTK